MRGASNARFQTRIMKKIFGLTDIRKLVSKLKAPRSLAVALVSLCVVAPAFESSYANRNRVWQGDSSTTERARPGRQFVCGYDPLGAEDEWHNHKLNALRLRVRPGVNRGFTANGLARPQAQDVRDVAVIEDDGAIVIPPSKFDLKKRSLLFTPDGDGYRITRE